MRRVIRIWLKLLCLVPVLVFIAVLIDSCNFRVYSTTNLEDYGVITGNGDNSRAQELFDELFPEQIETHFENIQYRYKAFNVDSWDFEIYLEFTIAEEDTFLNYVHSVAPEDNFVPFAYDENFLEYTVSNYYQLDSQMPCWDCKDSPSDCHPSHANIDCAEIAKILVNPMEQRIVIVALGVHDGGGADATDFTQFFDRFGIDPFAYDKIY